MTLLPAYWSDAAAAYVRIQIQELRRFHAKGEGLFNLEFDELKAEVDQLGPEEWSEEENHYLDKRWELDSLRELNTQFAIVGLFTVVEMFLRDTLQRLPWTEESISERNPGKRLRFDDMKDIFATADVPLTTSESDWNAIRKLQAIRNCIAHLGGLPSEEAVRKLKGHHLDVTEGEPMQLPAGYFEEGADLVQRVSNRIARQCQKEFPNKRARSRMIGRRMPSPYEQRLRGVQARFELDTGRHDPGRRQASNRPGGTCTSFIHRACHRRSAVALVCPRTLLSAIQYATGSWLDWPCLRVGQKNSGDGSRSTGSVFNWDDS